MKPEAPSHPSALPVSEVTKAIELVHYQSGAVVSREIIKRKTGSVTIFAFDEGQGISEHAAPFDALIHIFESEDEIRVVGTPHLLCAGELILLPAFKPHELKAITKFKMSLTMIRSKS